MELDALLKRAWEVRRLNFDDEIRFSAPSFKHFRTSEFPALEGPRFVAISVTGSRCELGCDHCRATLLRSMIPAESPEALLERGRELRDRGARGVLVSGGCDRRGRVPLLPFLEAIGELRRSLGLEVAVHAGLADGELARRLAEVGVDRVMMDLVGDAETALEVLHLEAGPEAFERSLSTLIEAGLEVVPHLIAGLRAGELHGEYRSLDMAARSAVAALVVVVLRPEKGTPMSNVEPPPAEAVGELLARARLALPATPLVLGCARPVGRYSRVVERYALEAGVNGLAFPADETVRWARDLGLRPRFEQRCCAM